ncbi:helix-turn-helix domain-containing protein [Dasania sp. GY-MA-18]|uniref:Helix-turn-helix domain-containing protein n=1 Tax=Dasania phycosphaerae TaxID=2950436 RepID=A0A9J6RJ70_9GAMM|nr:MULTISPECIES: helix-turn-helix domain-containing protein [Dasania]MCR8922006.1 helix-turn-helix domain-containing protein [Dasania sp. GY-MA-18]MCZ0864434.1 helix-turn-helix domain-containing protein [Dasania phycosphaerae]MCZ0868162.1 helix-turn-helix domain-containing protein [Dasania phycosphaerae]
MHKLTHLGFQRYAPSPALAPYVECYWQINTAKQASIAPDYMHSEGGSGIIFNFADPIQLHSSFLSQGSLITGPRRSSTQFFAHGNVQALGIRFKPGAGHSIFGLPLVELLDSIVNPAELALSHLGDELAAQLAALSSAGERIALIEQRLIAQLNNQPAYDQRLQKALAYIDQHHGLQAIPQLSASLALSQRQLDRVFKRHLGLAPKQYSRLQQVQYARQLLKQAPQQYSLTDIGYQAGFYDQAHFIRQFRQTVGITPGDYKLRASSNNKPL